MTFFNQRERKCPCCGKEFLITPEWAWIYDGQAVCRYSCMRKLERDGNGNKPKTQDPDDGMLDTDQLTRKDVHDIKRMRNNGMQVRKISEITGFSQTAVRNALRRTEEGHQKQKTPDNIIGAMKILKEGGMSFEDIAKRFNCSPTTVRRHVTGKRSS